METEEQVAETPIAEDAHRLWRPTRIWLLIAGLGGPLLWLVWLLGVATETILQNPPTTWASYAGPLLGHPSLVLWLPCVTFAVACLGGFLADPVAVRRLYLYRIAIYTGFLVAAYHWLLLATFLVWEGGISMLCTWGIGALLMGVVFWLLLAGVCKLRQRGAVACLLLLICLLVLPLSCAALPILVPTLAVIAYGGTSVYLFRHAWKDAKGQFSLKRMFIITAWFAVLLSIWRITVMWTFGS